MGSKGVPTTLEKELAICHDYALQKNANAVGRKHQVAASTVITIIDRHPEVIQRVRAELASTLEEKLSEAILEYVSSRGILDPRKLKDATLQQAMTSLGIGIDKLQMIQGTPQLRAPEDMPPAIRALAELILVEIRAKQASIQ